MKEFQQGKPSTKKGTPRKYPFDRVPVGSYFFVHGKTMKQLAPLAHRYSQAGYAGFGALPNTRRFKVQMLEEDKDGEMVRVCQDGEVGCRIYRTA